VSISAPIPNPQSLISPRALFIEESQVTRRGRHPVLGQIEKGKIVALLTVGCSRRLAARVVGCAPGTIARAAARDPAFAADMREATGSVEAFYLRQIRKASQKEQHWRAAAWALEHMFPQRYARRPEQFSFEQVSQLMVQMLSVVCDEVPVARFRHNIAKRCNELVGGLGLKLAWKDQDGED
jgi:hypothetical protein